MKRITSFTNVDPVSAEWPFGEVKDDDGSNNGTDVEKKSMSDIWQFFAKLAFESGITINDVLDNEYDGFQTYEAFRILARPYNSYVAGLVQSGTSAPSATVFENRLSGAIVWTRTDVGKYLGTLTGEFDSAKTFVSAPNNCFASQDARVYVVRSNDNEIFVQTRDSAGALTDGLLDNVSIEIRVYD